MEILGSLLLLIFGAIFQGLILIFKLLVFALVSLLKILWPPILIIIIVFIVYKLIKTVL